MTNSPTSDQLKKEILLANYWMNVSFEKELAQIYGANHPKRIRIAKESNEIISKIRAL